MIHLGMAYRVPTAEVLAVAIANALRESPTVSSQRRLAELVREKLGELDPSYAVTEERVRRTAISAGLVKLEVLTRDTGKRRKATHCPVCGSKLERVRNRTITGGTVTIGRRCESCQFQMGRTQRVPTRYVFSSAHPRRRGRMDERQRTL